MELLQGVGLFVCIGGILVLVAGFFLARKAFGSRNNTPQGRNDPAIWEEQGRERPEHDDRDIGSSGGFGNAPDRSRNRPGTRGTSGTSGTSNRESGFGGRSTRSGGQTSRRSGSQPRKDDDDVSSSGGFG